MADLFQKDFCTNFCKQTFSSLIDVITIIVKFFRKIFKVVQEVNFYSPHKYQSNTPL